MSTLRGSFGTRLDIGEGKKWNLLFPRGEWHGANLDPIGGSIVIDDGMLTEMVANWQAAGRPPLPIRRTHLHLDDVPAADRPELEAAFGLLEDFRVTAAGLEALTDWNDLGRAEVKSGRFNFWSPEWQPRHVDRRTGETKGWWLSGTALTNDPFFNSMPRVAASTTAEPTPKEPNMNPEMKKRMFSALKLAETATDEELAAAVELKCAAPIEPDADETPDGKEPPGPEEMHASVTAAVAPVQAKLTATEVKLTAAQAELVTLRAAMLKSEVAAVIEAGKREGKALDALAPLMAGKPLDEVKALVAAFPVTVPLATTGTTGTAGTQTPEEARQQFTALVDTKIQGGMAASVAYQVVSKEHPALAAVVFPTTSSTSTASGR